MIFSSITFLFYFLPVLLIIYYAVPKKFKNIILLIASMLFYFVGEPKYILLMIISILNTYIFGILISKYEKHSKLLLAISLCISAGFLIYFKYIDFVIENINLFLKNNLDLLYVALPVGISFYTFQMMSYLVDVYRKEVPSQKNILDLSLYVVLFPQLIAGPIVRYTTVVKELAERTHSFEKFSQGVTRFVIGLGKKVLIANVIGELGTIFLSTSDPSIIYHWMYGIAIMMQIYFDFAGYSDMAIGLGKMFGFEYEENFNYPYIATSITDFWRRWHMSLSSWFRDYIYIPLGGNRVSKIKWIRNIFVVWMLTGIWHGASWNFVVWGLYFAILLLIEKILLKKYLEKLPKVFSNLYTCILVMISFIIFNGNSTEEIMNHLAGLVGLNGIPFISQETIYYLKSYLMIFIIAIIGSTPLMKMLVNSKYLKKVQNVLEPVFVVVILLVSTAFIVDGSFNPFLYFRF